MMTAERSSPLLSEHDKQYGTPLWRAFERFKSTLDEQEISRFTEITLKEVLFHVRGLDRKHYISSATRSISSRFEPLIQFLDRHGRALDCMTQNQPSPSAIVWGILRVIIEVRVSASTLESLYSH